MTSSTAARASLTARSTLILRAVRSAWATLTAHSAVSVFFSLELSPLICCEHAAQTEQHLRVRLFEAGAAVCDLADLGESFGRVRRIGVQQWLEQYLLLFQSRLDVDEFNAALLEDVVHALLLIWRQSQLSYQIGILPPHAWWNDVKAAAHASAHVGISAWTTRTSTVEALPECERGGKDGCSGQCEE